MVYKGGKRKRMSTKRRMRANKRRNTRRNKGGQSMNPEENVNKKNYQDKQMELMEEGKPWRIPPDSRPAIIVQQDDPGEFKQMNQKLNDELDFIEAEEAGTTFGGKRRTKRRGVRRRKTRKSRKY
jgi:hypothetical protein